MGGRTRPPGQHNHGTHSPQARHQARRADQGFTSTRTATHSLRGLMARLVLTMRAAQLLLYPAVLRPQPGSAGAAGRGGEEEGVQALLAWFVPFKGSDLPAVDPCIQRYRVQARHLGDGLAAPPPQTQQTQQQGGGGRGRGAPAEVEEEEQEEQGGQGRRRALGAATRAWHERHSAEVRGGPAGEGAAARRGLLALLVQAAARAARALASQVAAAHRRRGCATGAVHAVRVRACLRVAHCWVGSGVEEGAEAAAGHGAAGQRRHAPHLAAVGPGEAQAVLHAAA